MTLGPRREGSEESGSEGRGVREQGQGDRSRGKETGAYRGARSQGARSQGAGARRREQGQGDGSVQGSEESGSEESGGGDTHLVHAVQELQEDGREAAALAAGTQVAPLAELVAEREPLLLQQHLKPLQSAVEGIAEQLHQGHHLHTGSGDTSAPPTAEQRECCFSDRDSAGFNKSF